MLFTIVYWEPAIETWEYLDTLEGSASDAEEYLRASGVTEWARGCGVERLRAVASTGPQDDIHRTIYHWKG